MDAFVKELQEIRRQHAEKFPDQPMPYSDELIDRIVEYTRKQQKKGIPSSKTSERLGLSENRLHYWIYQRGRKHKASPPSQALTLVPVEISSEVCASPEGKRQARFTVRSPSGWEVNDLTLAELGALLRSLI